MTDGLSSASSAPGAWPSREQIAATCSRSHSRYDRALTEHYTAYFDRYQELRGAQRHSARDLEGALPPGWERLASEIPPSERHLHYRSGKSSQTLALALLGVARERDPSLGWLWEALALPAHSGDSPSLRFEQTVKPDLLGEEPRQTALDALAESPDAVVCIEAKLREDGVGSCSCEGDDGDPAGGGCSSRVLDRSAYWDTATEVYGLPNLSPPHRCPISAGYQAVRVAAAARALAGDDRIGVFLLLYDDRNPYFRETGEWAGWPTVLDRAVSEHANSLRFRFRAVSWQDLVPRLPLDEATREWAREKHALPID